MCCFAVFFIQFLDNLHLALFSSGTHTHTHNWINESLMMKEMHSCFLFIFPWIYFSCEPNFQQIRNDQCLSTELFIVSIETKWKLFRCFVYFWWEIFLLIKIVCTHWMLCEAHKMWRRLFHNCIFESRKFQQTNNNQPSD